MKQAFTLIELLVVVLIIGILASIALPQYQTAVNKSRYAGLMPLAKAVKDAEEEMLMSKGDYTADLRDLSIQVPGTISQSGNTATVGDGTTVEVYSEGTQDFVKVSRANLPNTYVMYFNKSGNFAGGIHCEAAKSGDTVDKRAKQLCESLGGQPLDGTGTSADYVTYVLEGPTTGTGSGAPVVNPRVLAAKNAFDAFLDIADTLSDEEFANYFNDEFLSELGLQNCEWGTCRDEQFEYHLFSGLEGKYEDERNSALRISPLGPEGSSVWLDAEKPGYSCYTYNVYDGSQALCDTYFAGQYDRIEATGK